MICLFFVDDERTDRHLNGEGYALVFAYDDDT